MSENKSLDILGIKPIGDALNTAVTKSFDGAETFLKLVCVPAFEEFGLMFRDKVRHWRLTNVLRMLEKAQGKLEFVDDKLQIKAHPRVALSIIENSSLIDNEEIQELWAGLFAASCKEDGQDDENLIFANILKLLTTAQARLLNHVCANSIKVVHENGLITSVDFYMTKDELKAVMGIADVHHIDRELDYLRSLSLMSLNSGFDLDKKSDLIAEVSPSTLSLNLFVKCQGFAGSIEEYWKTDLVPFSRIDRKTGKLMPLPDQST